MHRKAAAWLAATILIAAVTTVLALPLGGTGADQTVPRYERAPYQREGDGSGGITPPSPRVPSGATASRQRARAAPLRAANAS